ncbi:hypothetical protein [Nocardia cyriacigeorgica]|uniref:WXG100 family type VII secretion target n=1 Tax=Nocardia cyriacigeorgica TaxID=135487 RepID=A0A5R8P081_9NOCA|nr:hypothetical protein [Nocardia cyriacigeorgica]TLF82371.1 hypothetical protein FEK34_01070 [Nocardia cyriacigeorgica]
MAGTVKVDPTTLQQIGSNLRASASVLGNRATDIERHEFGPAQAGRLYASEGTKIHDGLARIATWLKNWQTAIDKSGSLMSSNASTYATTEDGNVEKFQATGVQLTSPVGSTGAELAEAGPL